MSALTAIILTHNEADMLPVCLCSLQQLDTPVVVIDSGSRDGTTEIASCAGARVVNRAFDGFASQRNAALEMIDTEWALFIDADERLTSDLATQILQAIAHADQDVAGIAIPRVNLAFGRVLRGGGWWPDFQMRILRRGHARYDERNQVHEVVQLDGSSRVLTQPLLHLNYLTRREFVLKQHHYTTSRLRHARAEHQPRLRHCVGAPLREAWRRYIQLDGYRDGIDGLFMASVLAAQEARYAWRTRSGAGP